MAIHIDYVKCINEKPEITNGAYLYKAGSTAFSVGDFFDLHFARHTPKFTTGDTILLFQKLNGKQSQITHLVEVVNPIEKTTGINGFPYSIEVKILRLNLNGIDKQNNSKLAIMNFRGISCCTRPFSSVVKKTSNRVSVENELDMLL